MPATLSFVSIFRIGRAAHEARAAFEGLPPNLAYKPEHENGEALN
jgi:hypothetical protein